MDLKTKSNESIQLLEYAIQRGKYINTVVGRAYYAVFQRIKYYLESQGFNYDTFLQQTGCEEEREYSHGTIKSACVRQLMVSGVKQAELRNINFMDQLYRIRRKSDYTDYTVTPKEISWCLEKARNIVRIIENKEN